MTDPDLSPRSGEIEEEKRPDALDLAAQALKDVLARVPGETSVVETDFGSVMAHPEENGDTAA